ncbi:homologous-pairing protein 2 homolog [Mytilus galloprovincialis]|uniref:homologous-pairing protein 2 homolog n=1 Tax=Mytilus galloprovincialis TaxID=29158 RepID=UPI003F7BFD80
MSKSKEAQASKAVFDYLNKQNRPYSAIDICNNLHKEHGKTAIVKACEVLTEDGKIKEKINGKQKCYFADQSQFPDVDDNEIKEMDFEIVKLSELVQSKQEENKKLETELRSLNSSISTEDAEKEVNSLNEDCRKCKEKLSSLKGGAVQISPAEKDRIYKMREKFVKEWRKRKRMTNDVLGAILEGYPKTKKQLYEDVGIETDEDLHVTVPEI